MGLDENFSALRQEERESLEIIDYEKMIFELKQNIEDNSEESESAFNLIVSDYGFEYDFKDFVKEQLCKR